MAVSRSLSSYFQKTSGQRNDSNQKMNVRQEAKKFENNHNKLQQWKLRNKNVKTVPSRRLDKDFQFNPKKFEINACNIHFIREVKNNKKIEVLNEEIMICKGYVGERVWVTIDVVTHSLIVFHKAKDADKFKQIKKIGYRIKNL